MMPMHTEFRNASEYFREVLEDFDKSTDPTYRSVRANFDRLLLLGDRVCCACAAEELTSEAIPGVETSLKNRDLKVDVIELWLKALWWVVDADDYQEQEVIQKTQFNMFAALRGLDLLSEVEIELPAERADEITDHVRRYILFAKEDRNPKAHAPDRRGRDVRQRMEVSPRIMVLASLAAHEAALRRSLARLVARAMDSTVVPLLDMVRDEQQSHLSHFSGRSDWLNDLHERLSQDTDGAGSLTILYAHEGTGKSALAARLAIDLGTQPPRLGAAASEVQRIAPWLPGPLFHHIKAHTDPVRTPTSLVAQANTMLMNPVKLPSTDMSNVEVALGPSTFNRVREALHAALSRLVAERGHAMLILDGLDELDPSAGGLTFLPSPLPPGVHVLITSRECEELTGVRGRYPAAEVLELRELGRDEVPCLTHVDDSTPEGSAFNQRIFKDTGGLAYRVQAVGIEVNKRKGDFSGIEQIAGDDAFFGNQLQRWDAAGVPDWLLAFLVVSECCPPVRLEDVQRFRKHHTGSAPTIRELRRHLGPVNDQLTGLGVGGAKLSYRGFADYYWQRQLGAEDGPATLDDVISWLAADPMVEEDFLVGFLRYWADAERQAHVTKEIVARVVAPLLDVPNRATTFGVCWHLLESGASPLGVGMAEAFARRAEENTPTQPDLFDGLLMVGAACQHLLLNPKTRTDEDRARSLMESGIRLGYSGLACDLAERLLQGVGLQQDIEAGIRCLQEAASQDNAEAMILLGERLIEGRDIPPDPALGLELLEAAIRSDIEATEPLWHLAEHLFDGEPADRLRAEELLREGSDRDDPDAILLLAERLLDGRGVTRDEDEAAELLARCINDLNSSPARVAMAERLLEGRGQPADPKRALKLLEQAAREHYAPAELALAKQLQAGEHLAVDEARAADLYARAQALEGVPIRFRTIPIPPMPTFAAPDMELMEVPR